MHICDYVDARFSLGEAFLSLSVLLMVIMFGFQTRMPQVGLLLMMCL